jgi:hypothetical protein
MNGRDLPGTGDAVTWGTVCSPYDPRAVERWVDFDAAVAARADEIVEQKMADPAECGEYMQMISDDAWRVFEQCVASDDAIEGMRVMRDAVAEAMRADARTQAMRELEAGC